MKKPAQLRAAITAAVPDLQRNPEKLHLFVEEGRLVATGAKSLSFEYQYTLSLLVTDFADSADAITVPVLAWLRENQPELFTNPDKRLDGFKFETDVLNHDCVDLLVKLPLTERVIVKVADGRYEVTHADEPVDPYDDPSGWKLPAR
ncbi:P2 phage tail completion protein R (GpR) [Ralstonia sp. 25mfcol4.1]|uniref:phage tail protein n=1 Tax=Burkholderiaceae TaxID=119060 RepID=UPI000880B6C9|nr:phage tail protein [Ralstonia sp. 25mfcol4.1]SDO94017.1 P2 phage tail completion protein R (GpR) [Ralstonia sp. 25mfcol4.1]